jgi:hypothetical protein
MAAQTRPHDQEDNTMPNQAANREPAEGSRETALDSDEGAGITNRPLPEEKESQNRVPPRGETAASAGRRPAPSDQNEDRRA